MANSQLSKYGIAFGVAGALALGVLTGRITGAARTAKATTTVNAATKAAVTANSEGKRYNVPVGTNLPTKGPADALVTIVQWCDFPDPGCAALEPALQRILKVNPDVTRLVFRHYARPREHTGSGIAHQFAHAAHQQAGKFWEARALLLVHQGEITMPDLEQYAATLGLDWNAIHKAVDEQLFTAAITSDHLFSTMFDVHDSPALFINGRSLGDHPTPALLKSVYDEELRHAIDLMVSGVDKMQVYAELTKKGIWKPARLDAP